MSVISKGQPSIILRKIDPVDIFKRYNDGEFNDIKFENTELIKIADNTLEFTTNRYQLNTNESDTSAMRDKNNSVCKIGFTNINRSEHNNCDYCRRTLRTCSRGNHPVSIPIHHYVLGDTDVYDGYSEYGTWECAYADLLNNIYMGLAKTSPMFMNSEIYMKYLYSIMHPNKTLKPAKDYHYLKINGGWMDDDEYDNEPSVFVSVPFTVFETKKIINIAS